MHPFFVTAKDGGQRLCMHHLARGGQPQGQVLQLHPFAEEMNKSRRMASLQARALAEAGLDVLQIDLLGCGDSSGDFGDATWEAWIDDVLLGCNWLRQRRADLPLWLCGLRAGCLLLSAALARLEVPARLILLQPPASGKLLLQQFLRLKLATDLSTGGGKGQMTAMQAALAQGVPVEVAGYTVHPALAAGLQASTLSPPDAEKVLGSVIWLEIDSRPEPQWSPASQMAQQQWRDAGIDLQSELVPGPSFWQTAEIEEAPALIDALHRLVGAAAKPLGSN